jgi:hypothetical protein
MNRKARLLALTWCALGAFACATGKSLGPDVPSGRISIHGAGVFSDAKVTQSSIEGPVINLGRYGGELRGTTATNQPVNVTLNETTQQARGIIGTRPVELHVEEAPDGSLHGQGMIAGYLSDFRTNAYAIQGRIGLCSYDLTLQDGAYVGMRACETGLTPVTLEIPELMRGWSPVDQMASLGIFLVGVG